MISVEGSYASYVNSIFSDTTDNSFPSLYACSYTPTISNNISIDDNNTWHPPNTSIYLQTPFINNVFRDGVHVHYTNSDDDEDDDDYEDEDFEDYADDDDEVD